MQSSFSRIIALSILAMVDTCFATTPTDERDNAFELTFSFEEHSAMQTVASNHANGPYEDSAEPEDNKDSRQSISKSPIRSSTPTMPIPKIDSDDENSCPVAEFVSDSVGSLPKNKKKADVIEALSQGISPKILTPTEDSRKKKKVRFVGGDVFTEKLPVEDGKVEPQENRGFSTLNDQTKKLTPMEKLQMLVQTHILAGKNIFPCLYLRLCYLNTGTYPGNYPENYITPEVKQMDYTGLVTKLLQEYHPSQEMEPKKYRYTLLFTLLDSVSFIANERAKPEEK